MFRKNSLKQSHGFSLVELVVVIALISILLAIAWTQFSAYTIKSQMERQIRMLYSDLMEARSKAMFEKREMTLQLLPNGYTIAADGVVTDTKSLSYPIIWNNDDTSVVTYGTNGLLTNVERSVCLSQSNEAAVDAVVISVTRVQIGKKGAACASASIVAK